MFYRRVLPLVPIACVLVTSCSRDPNVVKQRYLESGNKYFSKNLYKEAAIMYRKALSLDKRYAEAYYKLALTQIRLADLQGAVRSLQRAIELNPQNQDAYTKLIDILLTAYSLQPTHPKALLDEVSALSEKLLKQNPKNWDGLRVRGYLALAENTPEALKSAVTYFEQADAIKPRQPDVSVALTQCYYALGQPEKAEKYALQTLAEHKDYLPLYDVLFINYLRAKRTNEAEALLKRKIADNPDQPAPYLQAAGYYNRNGRAGEAEQVLQNLLDRKEIPESRVQVGDFYMYQLGNPAKAAEYFRAGAEQSKKNRPSYLKKLAESLVNQRKPDEAAQIVETLIKENPKDYEAVAMRATLNLLSGKKEKIQSAIDDLTVVSEKLPNEPTVKLNLGRAYLMKGDLEQSKLALLSAIKVKPTFMPARLALCQVYQRKGEYGNVLQAASEALTVDPKLLQAKLIRTDAMLNVGQFKQVRSELEDLLKENPNLRDAKFQLGLLNLREGRLSEAESLFREVEQAGDLRATLALADVYIAQKNPEKAFQLLEVKSKQYSKVPEMKMALGKTYLAAQKFDQAQRVFDELYAEKPESGEITLHLAEALRRQGQLPRATELSKKAAKLLPNNIQPLVQLAQIYEVTNDRASAKPIYEQIVRIQSDNPVALNNLAFMMAESDESQLDSALTLAQRAKASLPDNLDISDTIAYIYTKKRLNENAISILRGLIDKRPANPIYRYHMALALSQKGDKDGAKKEIDVALKNKPAADDEAKIKALLSKIS